MSKNYPQMYDRDTNFSTQAVTKYYEDNILLWLDDLDLPPPLAQSDAPLSATAIMASCTEYIRVYEEDTDAFSVRDIAILCGSINQLDSEARFIKPTEYADTADIYIEMNFDLERAETLNFTGRGCRILYTAGYPECDDQPVSINLEEAWGVGLITSTIYDMCSKDTHIQFTFLTKCNKVEITILYFDSAPTCD